MAVIPSTTLSANNIGKKFRKEWIFRNVSLELISGDCMAVFGTNGSGKSTFLKIVSGFMTPSEGQVHIQYNNEAVSPDKHFKLLSYAAPYLDLIDDMTLEENISFYSVHKPLKDRITTSEVVSIMQLEGHTEKPLRSFSSGMKQRVKLGLSILADTPVLLLDEPLSNMDSDGFDWYRGILDQHKNERIVLICSNNVQAETEFCKRSLHINDFKG
jgi:ABC-type multidrug transport system ATPase subunit